MNRKLVLWGSYARTEQRAKGEKLIPYRQTPTTWVVKSYTVTVTGPSWSDLACDCAAGRNHRICKHAAVVAKAVACGVLPIRGTEKAKGVASAIPVLPVGTIISYTGPSPRDVLFA